MALNLTPKELVQVKGYRISEEAPGDLWDAAKLCKSLGYTLNARFYGDESPSASDDLICAFTIRPTKGQATDQNTLHGTEADCITWDGINLVVKPFTAVQVAYDLEDAPPEPDPVVPTPEPTPEPEPQPEPEPAVDPEPEPGDAPPA